MDTGRKPPTRQELRTLVLAAVTAPSVHNTQPWQFVLRPSSIALRADRRRQLGVLDPTGRQLVISCGCALLNLRAAAAAAGYGVAVERFPDPADHDVLACVDVHDGESDVDLAVLQPALRRRQTNRRRFEPEPVPSAMLAALHAAVRTEGADLVDVDTAEQRAAVSELTRVADRAQLLDPGYRAELRAWTTDDPTRGDGVFAMTVPQVAVDAGDDLPIRDFPTSVRAGLPARTESRRDQTLVVLCTDTDEPTAWLRAGEGLERLLLEIAAVGWTASPFTQAIEVPAARVALQRSLGLTAYPHLLIRIGRAAPTPGSPRRHLAEVIVDG